MRNILIFIILISGLIFTSLIKNKTRLLEKELLYLDNEINNLSTILAEATLDFQYLTTPKHISFLAKNFLDDNFSYYKESQIKKSTRLEKDTVILKKEKNDNTFSKLNTDIPNKDKSSVTKENANIHLPFTKKIETQIIGDTFVGEETVKYLTVSKKMRNNNTFSQLNIEELVNKKSNLVQEIDNRQSKKKTVKKRVHNWTGLQIVKSFLGIPSIPVK